VQQQSPEVAQVRQELNAMRMEQVQREQQARMQAHEQYRASAANVIEDFRQATDEKGVALFPHASDPSFQQAMALELRALTQSEPQTPLEDRLIKAYDATVWKLPHTRQAELEKEMRIKQARAASEAKAKAEAARRREVSVSGAPGASALKVQSNGSVRDDILAAMEQLGVS
jgi:hypothetical protein